MPTYRQNVQEKRKLEILLREEEDTPTLNRINLDEGNSKILLLGDEHMGHAQFNREKLMRTLEWAYDNGIYILHMGDGVEGATRNSIGAGVYDQEQIWDEQVTDWETTYQPFVEKGLFLGAHVGNHEYRVYRDVGLNVMRQMCRKIKAKYLGVGKAHIIKVGKQSYTMYTTHGASGARLPHTKIKGALDLERIMDDVEIFAMGHVHQLSHHVRENYGIDKRNKKVVSRKKHFLLTGSYLSYWNSYAHMKSMEPSRQGSPLLIFDGKKHRVRVSMQ